MCPGYSIPPLTQRGWDVLCLHFCPKVTIPVSWDLSILKHSPGTCPSEISKSVHKQNSGTARRTQRGRQISIPFADVPKLLMSTKATIPLSPNFPIPSAQELTLAGWCQNHGYLESQLLESYQNWVNAAVLWNEQVEGA